VNSATKIFSVLLLVSISFTDCFGQYIPIDSVRRQDGNGVPILLGQTVTVRGVVTTQRELGPLLVYFQDPTGGLVAYDTGFANGVNRGDSMQVTGVVTQFNGLTELDPVTTFTIFANNIPVAPMVVTTNQIRINGETYEGRLIRINNIIAVKNLSGQLVTTWNVSGPGTNYRIFDGIDSCEIRIYATTNIANAPVPQYPFSVIAEGSQFDSSPPYNSGYQIIPRALSDFIAAGSGPLLSQITYTNIENNSVTITWTTSEAADSKVRWMVSDSNYQNIIYTDSVYNPTLVVSHSITLNNLRPGLLYNFKVTSANTSGSTTSVNQMCATKSTSSGTINIYFNKSVDTTVNSGEIAQGNVNFQTRLLQRINAAQYSIDMCLYSYNDFPQLTQALINARTRGVWIRFVYDSRTNQAEVNNLIAAGIPIQKRNYQTSDIMHNKFFVFDCRDTTSSLDDWVWTGSTNVTFDQFVNDANNVIEIQDRTLAAIYTREFEEMWGSHTDYPIPSRAKFGPLKTDNVPHIVNVNGTRIEPYFSPGDNPSLQIENMVANNTDYDIFFCIYAYTRCSIANRMKSEFTGTRSVRGIFDNAQGNDPNSVYRTMRGLTGGACTPVWNPPADVWLDAVSGLLHHKYMLIDPLNPASNPIAETGSYNYSNAATFNNDENYLIVYSQRVANLYLQEWYKRYKDAGGQYVIGIEQVSAEMPKEFKLFQNYPNPFNPKTIINFSIGSSGQSSTFNYVSLKVYDMLGREVATLINEELKPGTHQVKFEGTNLASGVYYYQLSVINDQFTIEYADVKKMVLIR
jgi:phosphatidylserine/phosphatidylglycerophosphate/cardiolipin synthase-like enzyme